MPKEDVRQPDAMDSFAGGLQGMSLPEAQDLARDLGVKLDVLGVDDDGLSFVTSDYREGRVRAPCSTASWSGHSTANGT